MVNLRCPKCNANYFRYGKKCHKCGYNSVDDLNYLSEAELKFSRKEVNLQIALGLKTCKSVKDVCGLLDDIREHERRQIKNE